MNIFVMLIGLMVQWAHLLNQVLYLYKIKNAFHFRRWWVKSHLQKEMREIFGAYNALFLLFMREDHEEFYNMTRMTPDDFEELHNLIAFKLEKHSRREPLSTRLRLALTLDYFANGDSAQTTHYFYRVGRSTVYAIVAEVAKVIWDELSPWYLRPRTSREWKMISIGFRTKWFFPNVLGALDGREFEIRPPPRSGSLFYCYKRFHSFKVMAMCDAYSRFTWVDVGQYGHLSDRSAFMQSKFYQDLVKGDVDLPPNCDLPRTGILMPHFIIGDEIFLATQFVMIPFARRNELDDEQKNFNYRLSKARHTIEAAYGFLTGTWQILKSVLGYNLSTSINIVLATICLHNFLITRRLQRGEEIDFSEFIEDNPGDRRVNQEDIDMDEDAVPQDIIRQRQILTNYFMSDAGAI